MRNISFFIISLIAVHLSAVEDLGTFGGTHSIREKNFMDEVEQKAKDINKTKLTQEFHKSAQEQYQVNTSISLCTKTTTREFEPTFIVPTDVVMPSGKIIARAGERVNTLELMKKNNITFNKYLIFIDVDNEAHVKLSRFYKDKGVIFTANGNMDKYEQKAKMPSFKADDLILEKFNINCYPSIVKQNGNKLTVYEYKTEELLKGN